MDTNIIPLVFLVLLYVAALGIVLPLLWPLFHGGAPYVGSRPWRVKHLIAAAKLTPQDVVADLGSGDGRIVIAAAQAGVHEAIGYEIQPALVWVSWLKARMAGAKRARFVLGSFWNADLRKTTIVFTYQLNSALRKLVPKLLKELPLGARVISNGFHIPGWTHVESEHDILVYRIDDQRG